MIDLDAIEWPELSRILHDGVHAPELPAWLWCATCDWGGCEEQTQGWRWSDQKFSVWLPVCAEHHG